jgi:hypothetical protein
VNEIRKKLERITQYTCGCGVGPEPLCTCWDSVEALRLRVQGMKELADEALALLPPDGETRGDGGPPKLDPYTEGYEDCGAGRPNKLVPGSRPPAPSSEKALRERCEALVKRWDSESGRESFAPVFAEELLEALASSPAPEAPRAERDVTVVDHGKQFGSDHWYTFACPWCNKQIMRPWSKDKCEYCQEPIRWKGERSATT